MIAFPLKHSVSLHIVRMGCPIPTPVILVALAPPLLRIMLIAPIVPVSQKLPLAPLIFSRLLAVGIGAVSLTRYILQGNKYFSAMLASPFHICPSPDPESMGSIMRMALGAKSLKDQFDVGQSW